MAVFFICFRECLESSIIVSVLLAFLKQTLGGDDGEIVVYKRLRKQVRFFLCDCCFSLTSHRYGGASEWDYLSVFA
jgi:hypothetical protein